MNGLGGLAIGIIAGVGVVYALKNEISIDDVLDKIDLDQEKFSDLIKELVALGKELLLKIYLYVKNLVEKIMFQGKVLLYS